MPQLVQCAVIGSPIAHSLSPFIHRLAYRLAGIEDRYRYDAIEVTSDKLDDFLSTIHSSSWAGLSVTAPHKQAVVSWGKGDPIVTLLQAANTVVIEDDLSLYNTDVSGMIAAIHSLGIDRIDTAAIVGNGATARSALAAVSSLGARHVTIVARDTDKAARVLSPLAKVLNVEVTICTAHDLTGHTDLLISTIPTRHSREFASQAVQSSDAVFELVYSFYPSMLNAVAEEEKVAHLDGIDLLVHQAVDQIRLMTGFEVDADTLMPHVRNEVICRQSKPAET